jgi:hypothetical protein
MLPTPPVRPDYHRIAAGTVPPTVAGLDSMNYRTWGRWMAMSSNVTLRGLLGLGDASGALQDSALNLGYRPTVVASATATRDLPVPGGTPVPAARLQTATLAGIADLFAVVAGTPDDVPG